ncbi:MAG: ABC transporter permease [Sulfolobales archaeon]
MQLPPELIKSLELLITTPILLISLAISLRILPTILFASMGELVTEKSGVLNLGIEGIMLVGAFTAYMVTVAYGDPLAGLLAAILSGLVISIFFSYIAVVLGVNQAAAGLGLWLFGLGVTGALYNSMAPVGVSVKTLGSPLSVSSITPILGSREVAELVVSLTSPLVVVSLALVPITYIFLRKTLWGLTVTSVGEDPASADAIGINVNRVRILATIYGGIMASIAGAYLSISYLGDFRHGMTAGRGFMALAMIYAGNWDPVRTFIASLALSYIDALQLSIASSSLELARRYYFFNMIPYIAVILIILVLGRRAKPPSALMKPFKKT